MVLLCGGGEVGVLEEWLGGRVRGVAVDRVRGWGGGVG